MSTYTPIASQTLSAAASSVTFSGIPQNYTDLVLVVNGLGAVNTGLTLTFNGVGSNYSLTQLGGNGSAAQSNRRTSQSFINLTYTSYFTTSYNGNIVANIMNYANTNTNKTVLVRSNNASIGVDAIVGMWSNTSAITSLTIGNDGSGNIGAGTTFNLYGIASGAPKASGGNIVVTDGTYYYHAFTASGTFIPNQAITADVLVVAGGGGGGNGTGSSESGGAGAGGLQGFTNQALTTQSYTITVGAGGSANVSGNNSQFGSLTASVGGGNGYGGLASQGNGGSGGGSWFNNQFGTGTAGQGNDGGKGQGGGAGASSAGGGGGATVAGGNGQQNVGGTGGNGSSAYSSWGSATLTGQNISGTYWFAGGGGGSTGATGGTAGNGGGGTGGANSNGGNGLANTGGGGGGGSAANKTGGSGGSGIVIVRYAV